MPPCEVGWRAFTAARTAAERARYIAAGSSWDRRSLAAALADEARLAGVRDALTAGRWDDAQRLLARHVHSRPPRFVLAASARHGIVQRIASDFPDAPRGAAERGDRLRRGEHALLGYDGLHFGAPGNPGNPGTPDAIDWHFDPVNARRAPRDFWSTIPYLDPACGDHKIIWELNRHQHWLALGRAFWLTGEPVYRLRVLAELASWMDANPPLVGINWASMLELAFRSLSWLWTIELFNDPQAEDGTPWLVDLLLGLDRQLAQIERNLSYYFSPNTHLLGEALALYVAGRALPELAASARREATGRRILVAESARQIAADGGHAERSTHYHRYALDFYLLALAIARITRDPIAAAFAGTVTRLASAARLMADDSGRLPHIGDDDGGMLLRMTDRQPDDIRDSLSMAAALVDRPDFQIGGPAEESIWMLSHPGLPRPLAPTTQRPQGAQSPQGRQPGVRSAALAETGYYVSRSDAGDHILIDGGPHGFKNGGHAHADALSLTFSRRGVPLLIDPGTGCYTIDRGLRDRFRTTASHNTLELDGRPQSIPAGPFQWTRVAQTGVHRWRSAAGLDYFDGAHDGYAPNQHRRRVLAIHDELLAVADFVGGTGEHAAVLHWHVGGNWMVESRLDSAILRSATDRVTMFVPQGHIETFSADHARGLGWSSPVYGRYEPATTLRITERAAAPFWMMTVFDLNHADPIAAIDWLPIWSAAGSLLHGTALRLTRTDAADYLLFAEPSAGRGAAWRIGELETDAVMLFVRVARSGAGGNAGTVTRVGLADGSFVHHVAGSRGGLRVSLGRTVPVLHIDESSLRSSPLCAASPGS